MQLPLDQKEKRRHLNPMLVYKILRRDEWEQLKSDGQTMGSAVDIQDGFVHFSTAQQLGGTAAKHFTGETGLTLLACDGASMGERLHWEPSRGGALFPHLYSTLSLQDVLWHQPLELGPNGHILPDNLP